MIAQTELKKWLTDGGRKLRWFAAQIPASECSVGTWVRGKHIPDLLTRSRLADVTGLEVLREKENWLHSTGG